MRGYLAITPTELAQLISESQIEIDSAFVQTQQFLAGNPGLGEEEAEYILSLLAAEDSLALQDDSAKFSFALAVDFTPDQLGTESDVEVEIKKPIKFSQADCLFVGDASLADGELTWYAAQEIAEHINSWLGK
jgi:hypothetical protein